MKSYPQNLTELNLINVKTTSNVIEELLESVSEDAVRLRGLTIISTGLSTKAMKTISEIVSQSPFLQKLNISRNNLVPKDFSELLEVIRVNKVL